MNRLHHINIICAISAFSVGAAIQILFEKPSIGIVTLLLGVTLIITSFNTLITTIGIACIGVSTGFFYTSIWRAHHQISYPETSQEFTGLVTGLPQTKTGITTVTVQPTTQIGSTISGMHTSGLVLIHIRGTPLIKYGDKISLTGKITKPAAFDNFNYPLFLEEQGVYGIINATNVSITPTPLTISNSFARFRTVIRDKLFSVLPGKEGTLLSALVTSDKQTLPQDILDDLTATATTHLVTLNASTITLIASLLIYVLPITTTRRKWFAVSIISASVWACSGFQATVARAGLMSSGHSWLRTRGRRVWPIPFLSLVIAIILFSNPLLIANTALQLAISAYAGLTWLSPLISKLFDRITFIKIIPKPLRNGIYSGIAITIATAPASLWSFGQVSISGIIVNPILILSIPILTLAGLLVILCSSIPIISNIVNTFSLVLARCFLTVLHTAAEIPYGVIKIPSHA